MADFKKLLVWQKAHTMALDAHRVAGRIRGADHSSLRSQMIRAAMSVPTNIAARESDCLTLLSQVIEVRKMLHGLLRHLASKSKDKQGTRPEEKAQA